MCVESLCMLFSPWGGRRTKESASHRCLEDTHFYTSCIKDRVWPTLGGKAQGSDFMFCRGFSVATPKPPPVPGPKLTAGRWRRGGYRRESPPEHLLDAICWMLDMYHHQSS